MNKQRNRHQPNRVTAKFDRRSGIVRLNVPLSVKADTIDTGARTFEGLAATWAEDLGSDVIHKGAFKNTIVEWKNSGEAMPLLDSHDHFSIFSAVGQAIAMKETNDGLWTKWEVLDGATGDEVLKRLRPSPTTGRAIIGKMSIGFIPTKFEFEQPDGTDSFWDRIRHINEADLKEVSLVLFPMNPGASIDATTVKSFMQLARHTDPKTLDGVTRLELRRLNTRIGLLLKKQKPEDEADVEDSDDTQNPPSTSTPSTPPARTSTANSNDDTDDADDLDDDLDEDLEDSDDEGDDADEQPEAKPESKPNTTDKAKDTTQDKKQEKKKGESQPYLYSDALKARLEKVKLQRKIGEATAVREND